MQSSNVFEFSVIRIYISISKLSNKLNDNTISLLVIYAASLIAESYMQIKHGSKPVHNTKFH